MGKKSKNRHKNKRRGLRPATNDGSTTLRDAKGRFRGSAPRISSPAPIYASDAAPPRVSASDGSQIAQPYSDAAAGFALLVRNDSAQDLDESYRRQIVATVSEDLGVTPGSVDDAYSAWLSADDGEYEDYFVPDDRFRYDLHPSASQAAASHRRALRKLGYEHFLRQPHPVFVYGTLRRGQGNSVLMDRAREATVPTSLRGAALYTKHWGFPYAHEDHEESEIQGELVWLSDTYDGLEARRALDYLEGFDSDFPTNSHYERCEREVSFLDPNTGEMRSTKAWVYFARGSAAASLTPNDRLESGDWVLETTRRRT